MPTFRKWKSINKFSDAYAKAQKRNVKDFSYRGKIKLHGSNAGIHLENGEVYPQKRSDFISIYNDNIGFAKFVSEINFKDITQNLIFYGEWAGPGIQKNDAVTKIENKSFFVFSVYDILQNEMIIEPEKINDYVVDIFGNDYETQNIYVIPWHTDIVNIDFTRQKTCQHFIDNVMKEVDEVIAEQDPYIKSIFGIDGCGEGLVMYGIEGKFIDGTKIKNEFLLDYMFKAKTESHSVQKFKNRNHVAPEKPEGIEDFISMFFTEQRFEQILNQIGGNATREKTSQFLKAIMSDVYKESEQEILLADFAWKTVPKYAIPVVKEWWFLKCNELEAK